jgi:hypothetical protein
LTNINGVGHGVYEDIHILKNIQIEATHDYFYPAELSRSYTVEEFIGLPDSLRTICLEPKNSSVDFMNIDSLSGAPLAGVENIVYVTNKRGERRDTLISNSNGIFTVAGISMGDTVSIESHNFPTHEVNDHKIRNLSFQELMDLNSEERKIPLTARSLILQFETRDTLADTLVNNVELDVYVNGEKWEYPKNSQNGRFSVELGYTDVISIEATKTGYGTNFKKIHGQLVQEFINSPLSERTIPMQLPKCNTSVNVSERYKTDYRQSYNMGTTEGEFVFKYSTQREEDTFWIYCGDPSNGYLIETFTESTWNFEAGKDRVRSKRFKFSGCSTITVKVESGSGTSVWNYIINCPS